MPPIISLGDTLTAPKRFRLWSPGNNPGDYGDCNVTPEAVARVMDAFRRRGVCLAIDYQHATNPRENPDLDPTNPPPIAGYAVLKEVQTADGVEVWVDPVRWSDCGRPNPVPGLVCCGRHQIESGQRGYISPDWTLDKNTREPVAVERLSLVAEPGTFNVNLLASRASANQDRTLTMDDISILKALLAAAMGCAQCADADCQALGVSVAKQIGDLASAKGLDLSGEAPAGAAPAADASAQAAACEEDKKVMSAAAAAKTLTAEDVDRIVAARFDALTKQNVTASREDAEKRALLDANKDKLGAMLPLVASRPLTEVKAFVAAVNVTASKGGADGAAPRGAPVVDGGTAPAVSLATRYIKK